MCCIDMLFSHEINTMERDNGNKYITFYAEIT